MSNVVSMFSKYLILYQVHTKMDKRNSPKGLGLFLKKTEIRKPLFGYAPLIELG